MGMQEVADWYSRNCGIKISPGVSVDKSLLQTPESGSGLIVDLSNAENYRLQDSSLVEVLRIPRSSTFSVEAIMGWLNDDDDETYEFIDSKKELKRYIGMFLDDQDHHSFISETNILIVYFGIVAILLADGYAFQQNLTYYLKEVLLKTDASIPVTSVFLDEVASAYYCHYRNGFQELFVSKLLQFYSQVFTDFNEEVILKVISGVVSRCLEIPEEADSNTDDFMVSTTLVPVLDFVNHDNELTNAYFDIDRKTNDILLMLDLNKCTRKSNLCEIFISYSPVEELVHFMNTYGFFPQANKKVQFWNLTISVNLLATGGLECCCSDILRFYSKLHIFPYLELVLLNERIWINDTNPTTLEMLLPFMPYVDMFNNNPNSEEFKILAQLQHNPAKVPPIVQIDKKAISGVISAEALLVAKDRMLQFLCSYITTLLKSTENIPSMQGPLKELSVKEASLLEVLKNQIEEGNNSLFWSQANIPNYKLPICPPPSPSPDYISTMSEINAEQAGIPANLHES
ncbi:HBR279Wp [Eremothecium sinecaudum]|uniref:HBR279Wp n=1 Tax=Eremothecium sinecaudum TaxID=45286 RepID=A0A125RE20_9SACH|nr:HBR279Wp [Eremothecium sinecaudum]AMD19180.1 HBR279Wp [Eremothecium sinecaudum]